MNIRAALIVVACGFLGLAGNQARAQSPIPTGQPIPPHIPAVGGGTDFQQPMDGVIPERTDSGPPVVRAMPDSASQISTTLEHEWWSNDTKDGYTRIRGNRQSILGVYTRGLGSDLEVAGTLPIQRVSVSGRGSNIGVSDIELGLRKYFYNAEDPGGTTWVLGGRVYLPSGDADKGLGLGRLAFGPSLSVFHPVGKKSLLSAGGGYTVVTGSLYGGDLKDVYYVWAGGTTALSARTTLQYSVVHFRSVFEEKYTRVIVGPRIALSPTRGIQVNFKRELQAAGQATTIAVGYVGAL